MVEFTIVALLLFTLIFGIIGQAYMMSFRQAISQGAAEGARAAAVAATTSTTAQKQTLARNALNEALSSYQVTCGTLNATTGVGALTRGTTGVGSCTITIAACTNNTSKTCASVRVDYLYRAHPLLPSIPGLGVTLPTHLAYTAVAEIS